MNACWNIQIDSQQGEQIPEELFGQNLEITRSTMFGGIGAQRINNRKFYAKGSEAFARGWSSVGACCMKSDGVVRRPALVLSDEPAGVRQSSPALRLREGRSFCWRLRLRGCFDAEVSLIVGTARATVHCRSKGARIAAEGTLSICEPDEGETLYIIATGTGSMVLESASLLPSDSILGGLRPDVVAALRTMRPHSLRFPGGCYAEFCDWKQGLLAQDERETIYVEGMDFLLGDTFHQDPQDMNLDDFVALCHLVGAQPQYTVRMTDTAPEDAAALVEYANGDIRTRWGAVRAKRGFPEPYGIRRWYIGNEIYPFVSGMQDPIAAARRTVEFARAMKRADPAIELVPSNWALSEWNAAFLCEIERLGGAALLSYASYHQYLLDILQDYGDALVVEKALDPDSLDQVEVCLRAPVERILPRMRAVRRELQSAGHGVGGLPVTMDEWNYYWGRTGHPVLALYMMGIFHVLIRHGGEVGIREAMYFHPINEGILRVTANDVRLEDGARAWQLARLHGGRRLLSIESVGAEHACDVVASASENTVYLTIVNRSLRAAECVVIPQLLRASMVRIECWRMEDPVRDSYRAGSMRPYALTFDTTGTLAMPAASMAGIWFEMEGME